MNTGTIKPICVRYPKNLPRHLLDGVFKGLEKLVQYAGLAGRIEVKDVADWEWERRLEGDINPRQYRSTRWFIETARRTAQLEHHGRNLDCLYAPKILECLAVDPLQSIYPHFPVLITLDPLYSKHGQEFFDVVGLGQAGVGGVVSLHRCLGQKDNYWHDYGKHLGAHEGGHMFGLIPEHRTEQAYTHEKYGKHCLNDCAMLLGPEKKLAIKDKLASQLFCDLCQKNLDEYFGSRHRKGAGR